MVMPEMAPDKGAELRRIATERGLRGIVFLGDDLSDLAAFREIARRREGGLPGLCIAVVDAETRPEVIRDDQWRIWRVELLGGQQWTSRQKN